MSDIIFETILHEATSQVSKLVKTGVAIDEAISHVADDLMLTVTETEELKVRAKKAPTPKVIETEVEDEEVLDVEADVSPIIQENTIVFSADTIDTAVGVLMYKGIPWIHRDGNSLTFASADDVAKAKEVLKRRWDFVSANQRKVATIEFDNLEDYMKVLAFMDSKRMTAIVNYGGDELDNDLDLELAEAELIHKKAKKDAKEAGLPAPEKLTTSMSYTALNKDTAIDLSSLDPVADPTVRSLIVLKRW